MIQMILHLYKYLYKKMILINNIKTDLSTQLQEDCMTGIPLKYTKIGCFWTKHRTKFPSGKYALKYIQIPNLVKDCRKFQLKLDFMRQNPLENKKL